MSASEDIILLRQRYLHRPPSRYFFAYEGYPSHPEKQRQSDCQPGIVAESIHRSDIKAYCGLEPDLHENILSQRIEQA